MYVRTLSRTGDAGASPSGPHFVSGHPPFDRHPRDARRESVIRVSQARFAKPRTEVDEEMQTTFFNELKAA